LLGNKNQGEVAAAVEDMLNHHVPYCQNQEDQARHAHEEVSIPLKIEFNFHLAVGDGGCSSCHYLSLPYPMKSLSRGNCQQAAA
jgi:hypothetical protein